MNFRFDDWLWLSWATATLVAGLLFGLATWLPFAKIRFLPSRLALAAGALVPVTHFWWVAIEGHASGGWLGSFYWFHDLGIQFVHGCARRCGDRLGLQAKDLHASRR